MDPRSVTMALAFAGTAILLWRSTRNAPVSITDRSFTILRLSCGGGIAGGALYGVGAALVHALA